MAANGGGKPTFLTVSSYLVCFLFSYFVVEN